MVKRKGSKKAWKKLRKGNPLYSHAAFGSRSKRKAKNIVEICRSLGKNKN